MGLCAMLIIVIFLMIKAWLKQSGELAIQQEKREERIMKVVENNTKAYTAMNDSLQDQHTLMTDALKIQRRNREALLSRPCMKSQD